VGAFNREFVQPLYEYIDEKLEDQTILLYLLTRYKHLSEWFRKPALREKLHFGQEERKAEEFLGFDLYEFLFSQGLSFHLEPKSSTGKIDLISDQVGHDRLLVEVKIFDGKATNIISGFNQIYTYTAEYNQTFGCLVIFDIGEIPLCFSIEKSQAPFSVVSVGGKTIFLMTIDIGERPTASKRGKLRPIILTESQLIEGLPS
jgi:hypothetical protein